MKSHRAGPRIERLRNGQVGAVQRDVAAAGRQGGTDRDGLGRNRHVAPAGVGAVRVETDDVVVAFRIDRQRRGETRTQSSDVDGVAGGITTVDRQRAGWIGKRDRFAGGRRDGRAAGRAALSPVPVHIEM